MGYKVEISVLEGLKKTLLSNNKLLNLLKEGQNDVEQNAIENEIAKNDKQIKLLEDEYYIGKK